MSDKIELWVGPTREHFKDDWHGPDGLVDDAAKAIRKEFKDTTGWEMSYDLSYHLAAAALAVWQSERGLRSLNRRAEAIARKKAE